MVPVIVLNVFYRAYISLIFNICSPFLEHLFAAHKLSLFNISITSKIVDVTVKYQYSDH